MIIEMIKLAEVITLKNYKRKRMFLVNYFTSHKLQLFAVIYFFITMILIIFAPLIATHDPIEIISGERLLPPSKEHLFGTDINCMDIFSRTIYAYRVDILIALMGALFSFGVGVPLGIFIGYFEGEKRNIFSVVSFCIMRIMDVIQALPIFVLALVLIAAVGPSKLNIIFCIFITNLPVFLRLSKAEAVAVKNLPYIEAATIAGNSEFKKTFVHIFPNAITQSVAMISMVMGMGILLTAGISFVGAGIQVPTPEWGLMISVGARSVITGQWWPSFFPGLFMAITVFAFSMFGEAITTLFNPLERRKI